MDNRSNLSHGFPGQASLDTNSTDNEGTAPVGHNIPVQPLATQGAKRGQDGYFLTDTSVDDPVVFERVTSDPYVLSYTCLIIPRFGSHYLIGDLADKLPDWMQQVCISFDWRLDILTIDPEFLEWGLHVPATTPPAYFMRIIRQQTSLQILTEFARLRRENLSNAFWAAGYLVTSGILPYSREVITQFIRQTRKQQGGDFIRSRK